MLKIYAQNVWGGRVFGPFCERLAHVRDQVHLFCFQEVLTSPDGVQPYTTMRTNLLAELQYWVVYGGAMEISAPMGYPLSFFA